MADGQLFDSLPEVLRDLSDPSAVISALREYDDLGQTAFLQKYGFGESVHYLLVHDGRDYDAKAIVGAAHGYQFPDQGPLGSAEFTSGPDTVVRKLRGLGFQVRDSRDDVDGGGTLGNLLADFLKTYNSAKGDRFSGSHDASKLLNSAAQSIRSALPPPLAAAQVRASVGQGNWAAVPWIAVLDPRVTKTTQEGIYPVILIPEDLSGVYVTIAQGVTTLKKAHGTRVAYEMLRERADRLAARLPQLRAVGFAFGSTINLGRSPLGRDYAASVIVAKFSPVDGIRTSTVAADFKLIQEQYAEVLEGSLLVATTSSTASSGVAPYALRELADDFVNAVKNSGMRIDEVQVRAFVAGLLAKPFAILTGQSGSGKTQLAKRLGEWCGPDADGQDRYLVVPVRPDWTGPEYLFGYPDGLAQKVNGRQVWAVPATLEFLLRARADPQWPYVLVLDEMNLAHVERYFADFLSGIESHEPVLPELLTDADGQWVEPAGGGSVALPGNLFVIGTVNVDETTYMFSPKVLDRAFVHEFRVTDEQLDPALGRPERLSPATEGSRRTAVGLLRDPDWHLSRAHPEQAMLVDELRKLHQHLSKVNLDFGHRVMLEAMRFAAIANAAGISDHDAVLDLVFLSKLLPKVHGSRQRLTITMETLLAWAAGPDEGVPRLPRSFAKLRRMHGVLIDTQFVTFTE